ncbi:hypothetical protein LIER_32276 [Lithospermum erythrorhizon]|uniref:Uncharacterized protein n=1 Tax=Lithospermum erythrorhizon TaxID=34254 RepID=A0AAV3RV66_LITER
MITSDLRFWKMLRIALSGFSSNAKKSSVRISHRVILQGSASDRHLGKLLFPDVASYRSADRVSVVVGANHPPRLGF